MRGPLLLAGALLALMLGAMLAKQVAPGSPLAAAQAVLSQARSLGWTGSLVLGGAQTLVALSGVLPAALLGVAAGSLYGLAWGFALASASTLLGAWLAFALGRSVWRPMVARLLSRRRRLQDLDARIAQDGWRIVLLLRVSPVMPFSATSYALGLSAVSARDYMLGTLACLPALFGYVGLGTMASAGLDVSVAGGKARALLLIGGAAATLLLTIRLGRIAAVVFGQPADALQIRPAEVQVEPRS